MGPLLSRLRVDHAAPYSFKFSGFTLWLLVANTEDVQHVIDEFNPNCPRRIAHSTLEYGLQLDEATARARFEKLRAAVAGTGPVALPCGGPQMFGDYSPFQMRVIGLAFGGRPGLDALRLRAADAFEVPARGSHFPHASMVYDWIGSTRVNETVVDDIRRRYPALDQGREIVFDGVALVAMEGRGVGEWEVLDRIDLRPPPS